jgi:3-oxoacyl-[acyl-carrier-protein] synthase II
VAKDYLRFSQEPDPRVAYESVDPLGLIRNAPNLVACLLSMVHDARGPNLTVSTACTSSAQSIGEAMRRVRRGEADVMLAGGTDSLVEAFMLAGFSLLGALSRRNDDHARASRPFDRDRDGFVLGEGAGFLVLEAEEHALARGATPLAELAGFGTSLNAYRITDSPPNGAGAVESMEDALRDARLRPDEVGYINAHGTSTQMNDASESSGIRRVFGDSAPPVSSTKSVMGHLVAACGAVEALACIAAVRRGLLPPTAHYQTPDPEIGIDPVPNEARPAKISVALSNSFGFGGSNGTLVIRRWDA